jgi:NADPH:quinone reductase
VQISVRAAGLNFRDITIATGLLPGEKGLGIEGAGVITETGPGVTHLAPGDTVLGLMRDAFGPVAIADARALARIPDGWSFAEAAAVPVTFLTAYDALAEVAAVQPGDSVLVHAAAGGVGLILCQWLKHLGVTVIGTVGSEAKAQAAREAGCTHALVIGNDNRRELPAKVKELTGGVKVPVVYDSIGKDTFELSLECLAPFGLMVLFGASSGPVPPFDLQRLAAGGSLYVTRPTLSTYTARRDDLLAGARELFDLVARKVITIHVNQRYPLRELARAHMDLESRKTTGSSVLLP